MNGPYQLPLPRQEPVSAVSQTVPVSRAVLSRTAREPDRTQRYGPAPLQEYDVWSPAAATVTVFLVHGGFWRADWDRQHLRPMAAALSDTGLAVALPEYHRTGTPGGTWPAPGDDLARALAAVREDADLPDDVLLAGHSAGGHLAVWLLHRPEASGVLGAVGLAGCLDLRMVGRLGLDDGAAHALMGGTDWLDAPLLDADPCDLGPTPAPVRLVHGRHDELVPLALSTSWLTRCGTAGRDQLTVLEEADHFDLIDPDSRAWSAVLEQVTALTARVTT